jgi:hypothetical protein
LLKNALTIKNYRKNAKKKCKIKLVPLSSARHKSNFYRDGPRIQALNKTMQMHQVPVPSHYITTKYIHSNATQMFGTRIEYYY